MAHKNYSIFGIMEFSNTKESTITFLQARNLIYRNFNCTRCGQLMILSTYSANINGGFILRCPNQACRSRKSLIANTF